MANRFLRIVLLFWLISAASPAGSRERAAALEATITPAGSGFQIIRTSLPLPRGLLRAGESLVADDCHRKVEVAMRALSWYPSSGSDPKSGAAPWSLSHIPFRTSPG
jgi:hypothetical protein